MDQKESLSQVAFREIHSRILDGTYCSGEKLSIRKISDTLNIGRTPVVNAINQLAAEGLVKTVPQSGTYVCDMSIQNVRELIEVRKLLETAALVPIMQHIDYFPNQQKLEEMDKYADIYAEKLFSNFDEAVEVDLKFHYTYISLVANATFAEIYKKNLAPSFTHQHQSIKRNLPLSYLERAAFEHKEMLSALKNKDQSKLQKLIESHYELAYQMFEWRTQYDYANSKMTAK